ncbi:hypothetical protein H257_01454 [Aphanomyces astaci]|uniref:Uncharacterized protein n=1 Tax=Aphanomyces astaci TaxID=112090 RepID=W4HAI0_APHAT|nr:hypothetical protein H257_01454 [Aphanomyces astaci]ETV88098.1 hypothetical protein H257_01454 [Aphanomyces astaci]|eukprot:XP_009822961.1 hypothetical protein H257_01454 [Aphanomyces astaci]
MIIIDMRWRCVVLVQVYGIDLDVVRLILGMSRRSVARYNAMFTCTGHVIGNWWPVDVIAWVQDYAVCTLASTLKNAKQRFDIIFFRSGSFPSQPFVEYSCKTSG